MTVLSNRHSRRRAVKDGGGNWHREQAAKRAADASDRAALSISQADARRLLAEYQARVASRYRAALDAQHEASKFYHLEGNEL